MNDVEVENAFHQFKECHTLIEEAKTKYEKTTQNIYQKLTQCNNGRSSIIIIVFTNFREYTNQADKPTFQIPLQKFEEWKTKWFGSQFPLSHQTFKWIYKKLYQSHKLHFLASRGFIRKTHIRQWTTIEPLLPVDLNEIQTAEDITRLLEEEENEKSDDDNQELSTEFHNEGIQNDDISIPSFLQGPDDNQTLLNEFYNVVGMINPTDITDNHSLQQPQDDNEEEEKDVKIIDVPRDGHCGIHIMYLGMYLHHKEVGNVKEFVLKTRKELRKRRDKYKNVNQWCDDLDFDGIGKDYHVCFRRHPENIEKPIEGYSVVYYQFVNENHFQLVLPYNEWNELDEDTQKFLENYKENNFLDITKEEFDTFCQEEDDGEEKCLICLEQMKIDQVIFHKPNICPHRFHQECIDKWKRVCENKIDFHCPACRKVFETRNPNHCNPVDEVPDNIDYREWIVTTIHVPYEVWIDPGNKGRVELTDGRVVSRRNLLNNITYENQHSSTRRTRRRSFTSQELDNASRQVVFGDDEMKNDTETFTLPNDETLNENNMEEEINNQEPSWDEKYQYCLEKYNEFQEIYESIKITDSHEENKNTIENTIKPTIKNMKAFIENDMKKEVEKVVKQVEEIGKDMEWVEYGEGHKYRGEMVNGMSHGLGECRWPDGEIYKGMWKNGKFEGLGEVRWPNGIIYQGMWKDKSPRGLGFTRWPDGRIYQGMGKDRKTNGLAEYRLPSGEIYQGMYDGNKEGLGEYRWLYGSIYQGMWKDNKREGIFTVIAQEGEVYRELYNQGERVDKNNMEEENIRQEQTFSNTSFPWSLGRSLKELFTIIPEKGIKKFRHQKQDIRQEQLSSNDEPSWDEKYQYCLEKYKAFQQIYQSIKITDSHEEDKNTIENTIKPTIKNMKEFIENYIKIEVEKVVKQVEEICEDMEWVDVLWGQKIRGEMVNGKLHGLGESCEKDGNNYKGIWKNGELHGLGECRWPDGSIYKGMWKDYKFEGLLEYRWPEGTIGRGMVKEWKHEGLFEYRCPNGEIFQGMSKDNKKEGLAEERQPNGSISQGRWKNDERYGIFTVIPQEGEVYRELYYQGKKIQNGIRSIQDGDETRTFDVNTLTITYNDGRIFYGPVNDKLQPHGDGTLTFKDNSKMTGKFVEGEPEGRFEFISAIQDRLISYYGGQDEIMIEEDGMSLRAPSTILTGKWTDNSLNKKERTLKQAIKNSKTTYNQQLHTRLDPQTLQQHHNREKKDEPISLHPETKQNMKNQADDMITSLQALTISTQQRQHPILTSINEKGETTTTNSNEKKRLRNDSEDRFDSEEEGENDDEPNPLLDRLKEQKKEIEQLKQKDKEQQLEIERLRQMLKQQQQTTMEERKI